MKELKDAAHAAESTYKIAKSFARASHAVCATYKAVCDAWDAYIAYIETTTAD